MSRIIVKNLPATFSQDPEKLKKLFSSEGLITDIQLKYAQDGTFRKFAFVGFKEEGQAQQAVKKYNKSFINTSRIVVEFATDLKETNKPRSWSKYSKDSSAYQKKIKALEDIPFRPSPDDISSENLTKIDDASSALEEGIEIKSEKLSDKEYMNIKVKRDSMLLENQESQLTNSSQLEKNGKKDFVQIEKQTCDKVYVIKVSNLPKKITKNSLIKFFEPLHVTKVQLIKNAPKTSTVNSKEQHQIKFALVTFTDIEHYHKALKRSKAILKNRFLEIESYNKHQVGSKNINASKNIANARPDYLHLMDNANFNQQDGEGPPPIEETGRIFMRNLPYICTEDDIEQLFSKYGPLTEVNLPIDRLSKRLKGFGFITFVMPEHAVKAFMDLDGTIYMGRMLHLIPAQEAKQDNPQKAVIDGHYKQSKAEQDSKENARNVSGSNWNTLFINPNAAADAMAQRYNVTKQAILQDDNAKTNYKDKGSAAVRLALGETEIVNETRDFLMKNGVNLEAFQNSPQQSGADKGQTVGKKRSKTFLIVKNLEADTRVEELKSLFEKHGQIKRFIVPPYGLTALVEYALPQEARQAFQSLTYAKFRGHPIYIEWAPENCISTSGTSGQNKPEGNVDSEVGVSATLFVKNLNFTTTESDLSKLFERFGTILSCKIATKRHPHDPSKLLSMGYGFVTFEKESSTLEALKDLQGYTLQDHKLELSRSRGSKQAASTSGKRNLQPEDVIIFDCAYKKTGAQGSGKVSNVKLLVRNVPFQASAREIRELFAPFGSLENVRLPKKLTSNTASNSKHKGYAFVEFVEAGSAKRAFEALSQSTHLYGRRLVLEWASVEVDVCPHGLNDTNNNSKAFSNSEVEKGDSAFFRLPAYTHREDKEDSCNTVKVEKIENTIEDSEHPEVRGGEGSKPKGGKKGLRKRLKIESSAQL